MQLFIKLTSQEKTKIILQAAHTYNPPTESSNRDVQALTITILHTKRVSVAGSRDNKEQALPQHHKSALTPCIAWCCQGNQSTNSKCLQLMGQLPTVTRVNQGPTHLTNVSQ